MVGEGMCAQASFLLCIVWRINVSSTQIENVSIYWKFTRSVDLWLVIDPYLEKSELLELSIEDLKAERSLKGPPRAYR